MRGRRVARRRRCGDAKAVAEVERTILGAEGCERTHQIDCAGERPVPLENGEPPLKLANASGLEPIEPRVLPSCSPIVLPAAGFALR